MPVSGLHSLQFGPERLCQHSTLDPVPAFDRSDLLITTALTFIALVLRIPGLDYGLWYDEIWTLLDFVRLTVPEIISSARDLNNHVLFSLSAHFTTSWFGESVWAFRLPAMVFGVLSVPAMFYLGLQLTSRREALLATTFLVFSYHHVWFSQNARGYSGVTLGTIIASILFVWLITTSKPRARLVAGYAIVAALTAWMHLTGSLIIISHGLVWLGLVMGPASRGRFREALPCAVALTLSAALVLLLYSPIFVQLMASFNPASAVAPAHFEWESGAWTSGEFLKGIAIALPGSWVAAIVVLVVLVAGVAGSLKRGFVAAGMVLFPVLVPIAVAMMAMNVFFPRFIFCALPFILFVGVTGGFRLASIVTPFLSQRQVLLVGLAVALLAGSRVPDAWGPKQDFAAAAFFIEQNQQEDSAFVCIGLTYMPMVSYLGADCQRVNSIFELIEIESRYKKTWLFYTLPINLKELHPRIVAHLEANYQVAREFPGTLGGGDIMVMFRDRGGIHPGPGRGPSAP